jgi:hypothetical protein
MAGDLRVDPKRKIDLTLLGAKTDYSPAVSVASGLAVLRLTTKYMPAYLDRGPNSRPQAGRQDMSVRASRHKLSRSLTFDPASMAGKAELPLGRSRYSPATKMASVRARAERALD